MSSSTLRDFFAVTEEGKTGPYSLWHIRTEGSSVIMEKVDCSGTTILPRFTQFRGGKFAMITSCFGIQLFYPYHRDTPEQQRLVLQDSHPHWCGASERICSLRTDGEPDWHKKSSWTPGWDDNYNFPWSSHIFKPEQPPSVVTLAAIGDDHPNFLLTPGAKMAASLSDLGPVPRRAFELLGANPMSPNFATAAELLTREKNHEEPDTTPVMVNQWVANLYARLNLNEPDFFRAYLKLIDYGILFHPDLGLNINGYIIKYTSRGFVVFDEKGSYLARFLRGRHERPKRWTACYWKSLELLVKFLEIHCETLQRNLFPEMEMLWAEF